MPRALLLLVCLLALLAAGCSASAPACTTATCSGCCDSRGLCQGGTSVQACGASGLGCTVCDVSQTCQLGACNAGRAGGGDAGADAGGQGDGGSPGDGGAGADAGLNDAGSASDGGSNGADGGSGDSGVADAGGPTLGGDVVVYSYAYTAGTTPVAGYSVSATFQATPSNYVCNNQTFGNCTVYNCSGSGTTPLASAGTIQVSGGLTGLVLTPDSSNRYASATSTSAQYFTGGETLSIVASGGDVPAFSQNLTAPTEVTWTAPALTPGTPLTVDRSVPLALAWSGASAGNVSVFLSHTSPTVSAQCVFPAADGSGVISTDALAQFPTGPGAFSVVTIDSVPLTEAAWRILLYVEAPAVTPSNNFAAAQVTFQ